MATEPKKVFIAPTDPVWQGLLKEKLAQYDAYFSEKSRRYGPPELNSTTTRGYSRAMISALLGQGRLDLEEFRVAQTRENSGLFVEETFRNSCAVVGLYLTDREQLQISVERVKKEKGNS